MNLRLFAALLAAILISACSQAPRRGDENPLFVQAYQQRAASLSGLDRWSLDGRLAIHDGKEGGSGNLKWVQTGEESDLRFRGALGQGAWWLQAGESGARIELANGDVYRADSVVDLVKQQLGWQVPVDALTWWVRGLAKPDAKAARSLDEEGRLTKLDQLGWDVDFGKYENEESGWLPARLTARKGKYLVKLVVKRWSAEPPEARD